MKLDINNFLNNYISINLKNLTCFYYGIIYKAGLKAGNESIISLLEDYLTNREINLKNYYGAYRIIIEDRDSDTIIYFGDNSGSCCFYYNESTCLFLDSFLESTKNSADLTPNYDAITEFLSFGCIYNEHTIRNDIFKTDPLKYYVVQKNHINIINKKNVDIEENQEYDSLRDFTADFTNAINDMKKAVVITGGTDSRTILSHMVARKENFTLFISGDDDLEDVKIASEISKKLGCELHVSDEALYNLDKDEFRRWFIRTDGVSPFISRFRLHKKNDMLEHLGVDVEIGGVSGELYKNSFLNQDFPFYMCGNVNKEKFYKMKMNPQELKPEIFTKVINGSKESMKDRVLKKIFVETDEIKYKVYFKAGVKILQYRMSTITNSSSFTIPIISPLAEISVMSISFREKPWKLELNRWHRKEVSKHCPEIAAIKTDRGTTLIDSKKRLFIEFVGTYLYLFKVGFSRLLKRKKSKPSSKVNANFETIKQLDIFDRALNICKNLNIINENVEIDEVPNILVDRLLTIAMVFGFDDVVDDSIGKEVNL